MDYLYIKGGQGCRHHTNHPRLRQDEVVAL